MKAVKEGLTFLDLEQFLNFLADWVDNDDEAAEQVARHQDFCNHPHGAGADGLQQVGFDAFAVHEVARSCHWQVHHR